MQVVSPLLSSFTAIFSRPVFGGALAGALALVGDLSFAAQARAALKTQVVEYEQGGVKLEGYLAYDDSFQGKRPGVLVAPEWWGHDGYARKRADQLAALGYVAFALDMYGKDVVIGDAREAGKLAGAFYKDRQLMRDRAKAGLDQLLKSDRVDPKKIAAIGYCFGGTVVLELARSGADLAGVVSFHGGLETPNPDDDKNIKGKILACCGGDDPMVPLEAVLKFEQQMRDANVDWEVNVYGGAKHAFTNPQADSHHIPGIGYNAQADHRSWEAMKSFFDEIFK